jgi:hypothetical protein
MSHDAYMSLRGLGRLLGELLNGMDIPEVTRCFNDWSVAQVMIADGHSDKKTDNYPPRALAVRKVCRAHHETMQEGSYRCPWIVVNGRQTRT